MARLSVILLFSLAVSAFCVLSEAGTTRRPPPPTPPVWKGYPFFIFGDSLVDVGNNNYFTQPGVNETIGRAPLRSTWWPWGLDYIPRNGRASNGRLIPDMIASLMGIPSPVPYMSLNLFDEISFDNIENGISFASGGAGYRPVSNLGRCIPYVQQVGNFTQRFAHKYNTTQLNNAVTLISAGGNDLFALANTDPNVYFSEVVTNFVASIYALYDAGLRNFLFFNLGNAGCAPYAVENNGLENTTGLCNPSSTFAANYTNSLLQDAITRFILPVKPGIKWLTFDQFGAISELVINPARYGYDSKFYHRSCCGAGGKYNGYVNCGTVQPYGPGDGPHPPLKYRLCPNRDRRIYFDYIHPSQKTNSYFASWMWSGTKFTKCPGAPEGAKCAVKGYLY